MSDWPLRDVRVNARRKKTRGKKIIQLYTAGGKYVEYVWTVVYLQC